MRLLMGRACVLAACAGTMLAGCVAAPAPAPLTEVSPVTAAPQAPTVNWQWSDAGPAVYLNASDVTAAGSPAASLSLICDNAVPSIVVSWDSPVVPAGLSSLAYRFDNQTGGDMSAQAAGPKTETVSDPLTVSRFIDQVAYSRQLTVRSGAAQASFATADDSGNLRRFRSACPDGTN